jgi:translation initiation factor eIF-2B subunit delta
VSKQAKSAKAPHKKDAPPAASTVASEKKVTERLPERDRKKDAPHPRMQFDDVHRVEKAKKRAIVNQSEARNRVELFRHLPQYVHGTQLPDLESKFFQLEPIHPSVYKVIAMRSIYPELLSDYLSVKAIIPLSQV